MTKEDELLQSKVSFENKVDRRSFTFKKGEEEKYREVLTANDVNELKSAINAAIDEIIAQRSDIDKALFNIKVNEDLIDNCEKLYEEITFEISKIPQNQKLLESNKTILTRLKSSISTYVDDIDALNNRIEETDASLEELTEKYKDLCYSYQENGVRLKDKIVEAETLVQKAETLFNSIAVGDNKDITTALDAAELKYKSQNMEDIALNASKNQKDIEELSGLLMQCRNISEKTASDDIIEGEDDNFKISLENFATLLKEKAKNL